MNLLSTTGIFCQNVGRTCISHSRVVTSAIITSRSISTSQWQKFMGILKVNRDSTPKDIKDSFLRLSKLYHPDNKDTGSHLKFVELKEAYDALKDGHPKQTTTSYSGRSTNPYDHDVSYAAHRRYRDRYKDYQTAYERGYGFGSPYGKSSTPWEDLMKNRQYRRQEQYKRSFGEKGRPLMGITIILSAVAWMVIYSGVMLIMSLDVKVKKGMSEHRARSYEDYVAYQSYLKKKEAARILNLQSLQKILEEDPIHQSQEANKVAQPVVAK